MKRILFCLLSFIALYGADKQLCNTAIVWGQALLYSDSEVVGTNVVIPSSLARLFQSRATPIIVNNCWARILLYFFAATHGMHLNKKHQDLADAYRQACHQKNAKKVEQIQEQIVRACQELWHSVDNEKNTDLVRLACLRQMAALVNAAQQCACSNESALADIAGGYGFKELFDCVRNTNLNDWDLYWISNPHTLMIFVPKGYHARNLTLERCQHFTLDQCETVLSQIPRWENDDNTVVQAFAHVFKPCAACPSTVLFIGHGAPRADASCAAVTNILTAKNAKKDDPESVIAGLPAQQFYRLIDFLRTINTYAVAWLSCFGGGNNAQGVAQTLRIGSVFGKTKPPIAISLAHSDRSMFIKTNAEPGRFFELVARAAQQSDAALTKKLLAQAVSAISTDTAIVLWPRAQTFESLE